VMEQLKNVTCFVREDQETIRYLEATRACYHYTTKVFVAADVAVWKYPCKGDALPTHRPDGEALMAGQAESVEIRLEDPGFEMKAANLVVTFGETQ
jgi:hypothetical protein